MVEKKDDKKMKETINKNLKRKEAKSFAVEKKEDLPGQQKNLSKKSFSSKNANQNLILHEYTKLQGVKSGFIKKWVNLIKGYQLRYFVLTPTTLSYYIDNKGQAQEKATINVQSIKFDVKTQKLEKVIIMQTDQGEIYLDFDSPEEKKEWLEVISDVQQNKVSERDLRGSKASELASNVGSDMSDLEEMMMNDPEQYNEIDKEMKIALNMALQSNIIKEDSALQMNMAETWDAQVSFEEVLTKFRLEVNKIFKKMPIQIQVLVDKLEIHSNDLKHAVTEAIKSIEETKIQIMSILDMYEKKRTDLVEEKRKKKQQKNISKIATMTFDDNVRRNPHFSVYKPAKAVRLSTQFNDFIEKKTPNKEMGQLQKEQEQKIQEQDQEDEVIEDILSKQEISGIPQVNNQSEENKFEFPDSENSLSQHQNSEKQKRENDFVMEQVIIQQIIEQPIDRRETRIDAKVENDTDRLMAEVMQREQLDYEDARMTVQVNVQSNFQENYNQNINMNIYDSQDEDDGEKQNENKEARETEEGDEVTSQSQDPTQRTDSIQDSETATVERKQSGQDNETQDENKEQEIISNEVVTQSFQQQEELKQSEEQLEEQEQDTEIQPQPDFHISKSYPLASSYGGFAQVRNEEPEEDDEPKQEEEKEEIDDVFDTRGDEKTLKNIQLEMNLNMNEDRVRTCSIAQFGINRDTLPYLKPPGQKVSIWKVIKQAVGKDLSRFCVPVYFNEPISMLQKVSEIMEYESLIVKAAEEHDQLKRLLYVSAFAVAQYKCSATRLHKPFNPILGETFELKKPQYKYFAEQVSHHPPVSACFATSKHYEFWMNTNMKTSFWGKSLEVKPIGYQHVKLKRTGEHFVIDRPSSSVNNIIFGEMYVEHSGNMTIKNLKTGDVCKITFKKRGKNGKGACEIEGVCQLGTGQKVYNILGKWSESMSSKNLGTNEQQIIWVANGMPPDYQSMYGFTHFALQLNHFPPGLQKKLPPTDSRFRPDQRNLEEGNLEKAAQEKMRLEIKQRNNQQRRKELGFEYKPKYFEEYFDQEAVEKGYRLSRDYWKDRKEKEWAHLDQIF